jgi:hypothetical protein
MRRGWGKMKALTFACVLGAITVSPICQTTDGNPLSTTSPEAAKAEISPVAAAVAEQEPSLAREQEPSLSREEQEPLLSREENVKVAFDDPKTEQARLEPEDFSFPNYSPAPTPPKDGLKYLAYYPYAEHPPERKPADLVLESLKNIPIGTPIQEIKRAADAFGLDFIFMKTVARIESDFDPKQRTGSYIGLFQLSHYEFAKYGSGEITNPRDNAVAAAYKFIDEGTLFELATRKNPTFFDLYLIHQQGWQGAAEHISHPERVAWKSMCATDEGTEKGEKWCKRAVWQNTLPAIKHVWKSVENLTSGAFVNMWQQRMDHLYARYSDAISGPTEH